MQRDANNEPVCIQSILVVSLSRMLCELNAPVIIIWISHIALRTASVAEEEDSP